ncbi:MAG: sulfatase-like hydrolase/transferase [Anaerolineae bacterium]|nr:sulfatase-like hydrolase/transferase [Anaerolineae bacterium]
MANVTDRRPNIVCIMPDDTDFVWLSCYGGRTPTPNIDRIATEGVRFDQMYCSAAACTPSRYSYLTGHYAGRCPDPHFLAQNPTHEPYAVAWNTVLNAGMPSLGKVLQANGYRTGISGKWHCGRPRHELGLPELAPGADLDDPQIDAQLRAYQEILQGEVRCTGGFDVATSVVWGNNESFPVRALQQHNLEWITQGALDYLDTCTDEQPFFLYITPTAFHGPPHDESYEMDERYTQGGKREQGFDCHPPRSEMRARLAARGLPYNHDTVGITWIDDQVGAILAKLQEMDVLDNTIVIFKVDHNTETGKGTCHQDGVRIPLVMRWPGVVDAGTVCTARVQNVDFAPTVFAIAGIAPPAEMHLDGTSWLPLLQGEIDAVHEDLFFEFGYARAVLYQNWKYIALRYPQHLLDAMASGELGEAPNHINQRLQGQMNVAIQTYPAYFDPDQLFNLEDDPGETHNLAGDPACAAVLAMMQQRLQAYLETFEHPFDLTVPDFMRTERYRELCDETRKIGTGHLSWWPKDKWWEDA